MFKKLLFLILLLIIIVPVFFFSWWEHQTLPVDPTNQETQIIVIPKGWGVNQIAERLKDERLIRNTLVFKIMVYRDNIASKLQAGDFRLSPSMNLIEVTQNLTHGTVDIWVTIPEGLRREEVADILVDAFAKQGVELNKEEFLLKTKNLEGFLFPDTYLIPKTASVEQVIKYLTDNFDKKFGSLTSNSGLNKRQIIILASLVEREAKRDKDRPIVAGILLKRLKKGWPLQVDATVQYAKADKVCQKTAKNCQWWAPASPEDLKNVESLYNTYKYQDLPPTAICNPGLSSIKAVASPQESDYWFYLSDSTGTIHYAVTNEEQEKNISKYLTP